MGTVLPFQNEAEPSPCLFLLYPKNLSFWIKGRCFPFGKIKACFFLINNRSHSPSVKTNMGPFFGKSAAFSSKSITYADVYYLQESVEVASSGGSSIDFPNIYFFIASILIILVFVLGNLLMTYKRAYAKWYLISILALYAIFTIGLYSLELISI
jgi:hypothetical protein